MPIRVVTGPPCAGKTTYCAINRQPGEPVVDWDALAFALGANDRDNVPPEIAIPTRAARSAAVGQILSSDTVRNAWIIYSRATEKQMDWFRSVGAEVITIDPGMEVCLSRAWQNGRAPHVIEAINQWYKKRQDEQEKGAKRMKTKQMSMQIKSADTSTGIFEGYASVFGNRDSYGDIVQKGAFAQTLKSYGEGGAGIPVYWAHNLDDPEMNIGSTLSAVEDDHGLLVKVALDLDNQKAAYVHRLIKDGRVTTMSFTYSVTDGSWDKEDDAYIIKACELFEVSVVAVPANREALITAAKNAASLDLDAIARVEARLTALEKQVASQKENLQSGGEDSKQDNGQTPQGAPEDQAQSKSQQDLVIKEAEALLKAEASIPEN